MVFYGTKHDYDPEIRELEAKLEILASRKEEKAYNDIKLPKQINLNTIGSTILQGLLSGQYVMSCIGVYFQREWIQPLTQFFSPCIQLYK
jgi:hypothetical protein